MDQNQSRRASSRSGKLDQGKVQLIRERLDSGATQREVALEFAVGVSLVGKIKRHEVWV